MSEGSTLEKRHQLIAACKLLGTLLREKPSSPSLQPFFDLLQQNDLAQIWPTNGNDDLSSAQKKLLSHPRDKELDLLWQNVMMGPEHLQAPPWGSVYLDHESVIFGDSCVELAFFLKRIGIQLETKVNEPEDHIGLILWYTAGLLEKENNQAIITLLKEHLLPWGFRYSELLLTSAPHPFFEGTATLLHSLLSTLQTCYTITPKEKKLYF